MGSTASPSSTSSTRPARRSPPTSPPAPSPAAATGEEWYDTTSTRPRPPTEAGFPDGFNTKLASGRRARLPPTPGGWPRRSRPNSRESRHHRRDRPRSHQLPRQCRGRRPGGCSSSAGARTIRTLPTSSTPSSAPAPTIVRRRSGPTSPRRSGGRSTRRQAARDAPTPAPTTPRAAHADRPGRSWRLRQLSSVPTSRARIRPAGQRGLFAMKAGDRNQIVWLQGGEPGRPVLR